MIARASGLPLEAVLAMPAPRYAAWERHLFGGGHPPGDAILQRLVAGLYCLVANALGGKGDERRDPPANAVRPHEVWPEGYTPVALREIAESQRRQSAKRRAARLRAARRG